MKIYIDNTEVFEVTDSMKGAIADTFPNDCLDKEIKNRISGVIEKLYYDCCNKIRNEWVEKISQRYELVPANIEKYVDMILSQPDYKSKSQRDKEIEQEQFIIRERKKKIEEEKALQQKVQKDSNFIIQ